MKQVMIGALVCLNLALLVALAFSLNPPQAAHAQVVGGGNDYMAVTANVSSDFKVIYVVDLAKQKIAAWKFDRTANNNTGRMFPVAGRDLKKDFGAAE